MALGSPQETHSHPLYGANTRGTLTLKKKNNKKNQTLHLVR